MNKKLLIVAILILFLATTLFVSMVEAGGLEDESWDESWTVEKQIGRVFYYTHGTAVWGHEFGFFKDVNDFSSDTLWLTFSSCEEKVKDFVGKDVLILLDVDGKEFKVKTPMLHTGTIGLTHVMTFTNWSPGEQLMDSLTKGRYVKVQILEPKELEALLDIKDDRFGLEGFAASRKEAESVCRTNAPLQR
ncbi:MAG: hypothetical protein ABIG92_05705 [Candidatus Omnitrophota bacterium]